MEFKAKSTKESPWPEDVRLKMVERSGFYDNSPYYQYGYYDGYQHAIQRSKSNEMLEILKLIRVCINTMDFTQLEGLYNEIDELINDDAV